MPSHPIDDDADYDDEDDDDVDDTTSSIDEPTTTNECTKPFNFNCQTAKMRFFT